MVLSNSNRKPVSGPAPLQAKIIKCSNPSKSCWYKDSVGEVFGVYDGGKGFDYVVWEDMVSGAFAWRHIKAEDVEILPLG